MPLQCTLPNSKHNSRLNVVVRSPTPFGLSRNGCWPSRGSQLPLALITSVTLHFFAMLPPELPHKSSTQLLQNRSPVFFFVLSSLLCFLILLLLLMSGNVHPNPGIIFPCSVCAGNVTWRGQVSAMLHLLQMAPSEVLTTFTLQIQSSWQLSLLEFHRTIRYPLC